MLHANNATYEPMTNDNRLSPYRVQYVTFERVVSSETLTFLHLTYHFSNYHFITHTFIFPDFHATWRIMDKFILWTEGNGISAFDYPVIIKYEESDPAIFCPENHPYTIDTTCFQYATIAVPLNPSMPVRLEYYDKVMDTSPSIVELIPKNDTERLNALADYLAGYVETKREYNQYSLRLNYRNIATV